MMLLPHKPSYDEKAEEALLEAAHEFFEGGGVVTMTEWLTLDSTHRQALKWAWKRVKAEDAARIGMAAQGLSQTLQIASLLDGGVAASQAWCEAAASRALQNLTRASAEMRGIDPGRVG